MMAGRDTDRIAGGPARHVPVLLREVVGALAPKAGGAYVDGTFGAGGYARAILEAADCTVLGIDRDPAAIEAGRALEAEFGGRLKLVRGRFGALDEIAARAGLEAADGVALDVGVSSMQLDQPARGFSFRAEGPLDMRMEPAGPSAADVVNALGEADLAHVLWVFGEERRARAVARAIVEARRDRPITRTTDLARLVERVMGPRGRDRIHPATRTFQALRIYVNRELDELAQGLAAAERLLRVGGRLAIVSFHSLEDRIVKNFLAERAGRAPGASRHRPEIEADAPTFELLFRKPVEPSADEIAANPRARSARLRAAIRTGAPARALDPGLGAPAVRSGRG